MSLTERGLNRATLARQLLLRREPLPAAETVHRVLALQGQQPASPYLALWNRIEGFHPAELDAAFAARELVRATLVRITLHVVHHADYPALHAAMLPSLRAARLHDRRYRSTGLTPADADELLPLVLEHVAEPRIGPEIQALLEPEVGEHAPWAWWAFRTFAPLHHVSTGGAWAYGSRAYRAAPDTLPAERHRESVAHLIRRYLSAFGPASVLDVTQFSMLGRPLIRGILRELDDVVTLEGPDGDLYDVQGAPLPPEDTPAPPRLLGMWESPLLGYADRARIIPPELRRIVVRQNGDALPTLLVDGYVAGVWRATPDGIEATAYRPIDDGAWAGLAAEAAALTAFVADRDPLVYKRYNHWWAKLPPGQTRLLTGL